MCAELADAKSESLLRLHREAAPDEPDDEVVLVKRAIEGDAEAFGKLYSLHLDAIYRYVYFRVGDGRDAEDLTEQAFLNAWEALPRYEQRGKPFTSWLYRIAHNAVMDHHRRRKPLISTPLLEKSQWEDDGPTALERIIKSEETSVLAQAISQLTDAQQQVIILRFIEDLSHAEVAAIIDKSEGACRVIQHRALAALNELLTATRDR